MPTRAFGLRDLIVQLTGSPEDDARLAVATHIAEAFGAHLIGAHLHTLPDILDITDPLQSGTIRNLLEASDKEADRTFEITAKKFESMTVSHELRRMHGMAADLGSDLAAMARAADLFIGTRPYGDPSGHTQIEERVAFGSGRGCLFLPPGGGPHLDFKVITVAWDGSREAARAVAEAMPFLARAKAVHVVAVAPPLDEIDREKHFADLVGHLGRYGVELEAVVLPYSTGAGEQIEQFAHQKGSDLVVMGAYGHGRMVEWIFGGATRHLLRHSTLPILMAH